MSEGKDPAIKLFGKIIQCQWPPPYEERFGASGSEPSAASVDDLDSEHDCSSDQNRNRSDDKSASPELADSKQDTVSSHTVISERKEAASSAITDNPNEESSSLPSSKKEDQSETSTSQEKTPALKKPDKIIPCPRCNSMDTKFCYFNNYNVNQPRHFCKNCQRYWTAGGTMRNVPVGAGRRRNKSSSVPINQQHNRHLLIHDAFQTARPGSVVNGIVHHPTLRAANGAILAFGSDFPLCESMASALNLGENSSLNCMPNGYFRSDQQHQGGYQLVSSGGPTNGSGDQSNGSCWSASIPAERGGNENEPAMKKNHQGVPVPLHQAPCFQETPWSYPWNPSTQWSSTPGQPSPFMHSGIPVSFYTTPPPYWGCGMPGGSWNVSWASPASISSDQSSTSCTSPNSPLGKHSRDGSDDNEAERRVLAPKTLRIDDPNEAAKSSIWATLGISKKEKENSGGGRLFEGFQLAYDERRNTGSGKSLSLLETNPAAMSRSLTFQETAK